MRNKNLQIKLLSRIAILLLLLSAFISVQASAENHLKGGKKNHVKLSSKRDIEEIVSAWKGHRFFAEWLVKKLKPKQIVDLGVDFGYSTLVFANAARDIGYGTVTGIDLFEGDHLTGYRNTHAFVLEWIEVLSLKNIELIKGDFQKIAQNWNRPINILHIDGDHTFEAVQRDFQSWSGFVQDDGIILFHDINVPHPEFKVIDFFRGLTGGHKLYFLQSSGLGIYTKNEALYNLILKTFSDVYDFEKNPL